MAETIRSFVDRCGGIRAVTRMAGMSVGGVQYWLKADRVPAWHLQTVRDVAEKAGQPLSEADALALILGTAA